MSKRFSATEVGLSHPVQPISISLTDDGSVLVQAGDAAGIVLDAKTGAVTIYGTSVNLISPDLKVDGKPVDKANIIKNAAAVIRGMFSQAVPKFPAPKE